MQTIYKETSGTENKGPRKLYKRDRKQKLSERYYKVPDGQKRIQTKQFEEVRHRITESKFF